MEHHLQHLLYLLYSARLRKKMESICSSSSRKCDLTTGYRLVKSEWSTGKLRTSYIVPAVSFHHSPLKKIKDKRGNTSTHKLYFHFGFCMRTTEQAFPQSLSSPHSILQQVLYQPYSSWLDNGVQPARGQNTKAGDSAKVQKDKAPLCMKKTKSSLD